MPHKPGAWLGSVRTLEDLLGRCVIDDITGCWHLRTPRGRPIRTGKQTYSVNLHQRGKMPATRAAWMLSSGQPPRADQVVFRTCGCHDCVNPLHLRIGARKDLVRQQQRDGAFDWTPEQRARQLRLAAKRRALTEEVAQWIRESPQSAATVAAAVDVPKSKVIGIRAGRLYPRLDCAFGLALQQLKASA